MAAQIPNLLRNANHLILSLPNPRFSLVWLHGIADSPDSYLPLFTHLQSPLYHGCRVILPQAPSRSSLDGSTKQSAWYEQSNLAYDEKEERYEGMDMDYLDSFMQDQVIFWQGKGRINPRHRVYVGGLGQGASMALHYALTLSQPPAGCIALSGQALSHTKLVNLRKMPILLMHGKRDNIVPQNLARRSYSRIMQDEYLVQYKTIEGLPHGANIECLQKMRVWMEDSHQFIRKHYEQSQPAKEKA